MPLKNALRDPFLWILAGLTLIFSLFSANSGRVEKIYSRGIYPVIGRALRAIFGWIPFSVGDILYALTGVWIAWKVISFIIRAFRRQLRRERWAHSIVRLAKMALIVYLVFESVWGLNYSRQGIATQLRLDPKPADTAGLPALALLLQQRLCTWGDRVDSVRRISMLTNRNLFNRSVSAYDSAVSRFPFLQYSNHSIKASLYTPVAHYFGFSGYYNPFTGEAQVHTGFPVFMQPFVVCHEMGHQLGYARENEANMAGFLAARNSGDPDFVYSAYFEMYLYTLLELGAKDIRSAVLLRRSAHQQVRRDLRTYRQYIYNTRNNVEPVIMNVYDRYLRLNNQQKGIDTYNEVVLWLLAYRRQYGDAAL